MTAPVVLLVSLNFPPSQIASVHRARLLARHLPVKGWRPIVITVDERDHKEPTDPELGRLVPPTVEVHRVRALPLALTKPFGLCDLALRSLPRVRSKIFELINRERPRAVFITGWPFYQMMLSSAIERAGVPVVLDFQDPWVSSLGSGHPLWSKARLAHQLGVWLEPRALRAASFVTSVSQVQNEEMAARYPWLDRARMAAIPIGGDPDDFDALRVNPPDNPQVILDPARINLSYVGTFLPRGGALVRALFQAVRLLQEESPELAGRLALHFVGTSNQSNGHDDFRIRPIAEEFGIADLVHETPQRVPYLEALNILANSQGLLLIGSDEPHYTASKIFPALMSGRPYLSLFHEASSAHSILSAAGGGRALAFQDLDQLESMTEQLRDSICELSCEPEMLGSARSPSCFAQTADAVSGQFSEIFDSLISRVRK